MITKDDLTISNKSYINKDFQQIYPELLDLVKLLTNKWSPDTSNESDPGVVLLKTNGFIGDKINYNIDKNILEAFLPSATQLSSVRNICELNGYNVKYYRSATTEISFRYIGQIPNGTTLKLKRFNTVISNAEKTIKYTLIKNVNISSDTTEYESAIEGTIDTLTIANTNSPIISLENLDDNKRIYFGSQRVAENGVFIGNYIEGNEDLTEGALFKRVENLNTVQINTTCFKFGFDSKRNLPYVEFPDYIANIIDAGLVIRYITTSGENGNVAARTLTVLDAPSELVFENGDTVNLTGSDNNENLLWISNNSSTDNGSDLETIDEAYSNYKRTVGTFDTLVTCRDYANAIYNMLESDDTTPLVSNVQVGDRRCDINYSNNVVTFTDYGKTIISNTAVKTNAITPFELCLYPLQQVSIAYDSSNFISNYDAQFSPLLDAEVIKRNLNPVEEDDNVYYKTLAHDFKSLKDKDIWCFKNMYILDARISTIYKVNKLEQEDIINNVQRALYNNFGARKLEFGEEIPYETLLDVIEQADSRIRSVSLTEPEIKTNVLFKDSTVTTMIGDSVDDAGKSLYVALVAKNVLAGRISLFEYDEDFDYDFGQSISHQFKKDSSSAEILTAKQIGHVTTQAFIPTTSSSSSVVYDSKTYTLYDYATKNILNSYKLKKNEVVQIVYPEYTSETVFSVYVQYKWTGANLLKNELHKITGSEVLEISYTDGSGNEIKYVYDANTVTKNNVVIKSSATNIFKASFALESGAEDTTSVGEDITILTPVQSQLSANNIPCYWIRNNTECLFAENECIETSPGHYHYEALLGDNEIFVYTDTSFKDLVVLGSGVEISMDSTYDWTTLNNICHIDKDDSATLQLINEEGLNAFASSMWQYINFLTPQNPLIIKSKSIITLTENDIIGNIKVDGSVKALTNNFVEIDMSDTTTIPYYQIEGEEAVTLDKLSTDSEYLIRSILDLNMSKNNPQVIDVNQLIILEDDDNETYSLYKDTTYNADLFIESNYGLQLNGGVDVYIKLLNESIYSFYAYRYDAVEYTTTSAGTKALTRNSDKLMVLGLGDVTFTSHEFEIELNVPNNNKDQLFMFYWNKKETSDATITITSDETSSIKLFEDSSYANYLEFTDGGIYTIDCKNANTLTLNVTLSSANTSADILVLGEFKVINGLNSELSLPETVGAVTGEKLLLDTIAELATVDGHNEFYYTAEVDSNHVIDYDDMNSPYALFDKNNLANKFTIPQLDFVNSTIEIVRTSKK